MGKQKKLSVLNRLAGKKLVFHGKSGYGVEDSLKAMAVAQQGRVLDDLDASVDYLVLADANASKTIQKKALALNGKGASIQVIDSDAFQKLVEPGYAEVLALLKAGESETINRIFPRTHYRYYAQQVAPKHTFASETFDGVQLKDVQFDEIAFAHCSFAKAQLTDVSFRTATDCDFCDAQGESAIFHDVRGSRFRNARFKQINLYGDSSGCDFSQATIERLIVVADVYGGRQQKTQAGVVFAQAVLGSAEFHDTRLKSPNFDGADLSAATFQQCTLEAATFRGATLAGASLVDSKLAGADFSHANLSGANLSGTDLSHANFTGADLQGAILRGATLDRVDLSQAKNYDPNAVAGGTVGPALTELDSVNTQAKRIHITFRVRTSPNEEGDAVGIDSSGLRYGWGLQVPASIASGYSHRRSSSKTMSDAMLELANLLSHRQVRFETVEVSSTKSPKGGKELRELAVQALSEAFAQDLPNEDDLAAATKTYRDAQRDKGAAERERRKQEKAKAEQQKAKAKQQIAKKIEKAVGKVTDVASFLKALEVRIEKPKIDKATKMLKTSGFKLFNDVMDDHLSGVVKSQTDPDLVYACRIDQDGHYACCTQNLNICGGLRGSICKHLLVLIVGLVQAGELDPTTIDGWIAKTHATKPELDKDLMGEIFLKYKGAEAGEVDWRPTETVPEDYYAL